jgi:hemoglobin-like flavoprotein
MGEDVGGCIWVFSPGERRVAIENVWPAWPFPAHCDAAPEYVPGGPESAMHPESVAKLQDHYLSIAGKSDALVERFYSAVFAEHPEVRPMFPPDMARQREHLATALAVIARNYDQLELLEQPLMEMGVRHLAYGTRPEHYGIVRDALLAALAWVSGERWTPELVDLWRTAIERVCISMMRGAAAVEAGRAAEPKRDTTW